jgi:hypothetical protein
VLPLLVVIALLLTENAANSSLGNTGGPETPLFGEFGHISVRQRGHSRNAADRLGIAGLQIGGICRRLETA